MEHSYFPMKFLVSFTFLFSLASLVILIIAAVMVKKEAENINVILYGGGPERKTGLLDDFNSIKQDLNLAVDVLLGRRQ